MSMSISGDTGLTFPDASTQTASPASLGFQTAAEVTTTATTVVNNLSLGIGQTWQNVAGSRASNGTVYTNNTGKPIMVAFSSGGGGSLNVTYTVGGVTIGLAYLSAGNAMYFPFSFIVPDGATYSIYSDRGTTTWAELR